MAKWLYTLTSLTVMVCIILLWLVIPIIVRSSDALDLAIQHLYPSSVAHDNNTHWSFVTGRDMQPLQVCVGGFLSSVCAYSHLAAWGGQARLLSCTVRRWSPNAEGIWVGRRGVGRVGGRGARWMAGGSTGQGSDVAW